MSELRFSRITLLILPMLMLGVGYIAHGFWAAYSMAFMVPLASAGVGAFDFCIYPIFLIFSMWMLRFLSSIFRVLYVSLMHWLYTTLWFFLAYSWGIYSHWCAFGKGYMHFFGKDMYWGLSGQNEHIIALVFSSLSYGVLFYALIVLARKTQIIKPEVTAAP
jgi:hypothetical protein